MKIKTQKLSYEEVLALPASEHRKPTSPNPVLLGLVRLLAKNEVKKVNFQYKKEGMERLGKDEPCLVLMNHSSFIDLSIAETVMSPRKLHIVCTSDGFVGKDRLLRAIGCIPTQKFVSTPMLVKDIAYCLRDLKTSVLLYPEASYSFDGTATPLPKSLGKFLRFLGVPVVMIETFGAFSRDPLYNGLRLRDVDVSAKVKYLFSPEDVKEKSVDELNEILEKTFSFDHFRWQKENQIEIAEDFRASGLERVLYKCPHCHAEGKTEGIRTRLVCHACGKSYEMTVLGEMQAEEGETEFSHIPDWYAWERSEVRRELEDGAYEEDIPVEISILKDTKAIYQVGEGRLVHNRNGFSLTGCDEKLSYEVKPKSSYSLYADYFWYELGDMVCIGDTKTLYYCFPKDKNVPVAKLRLAAEELYKMVCG